MKLLEYLQFRCHLDYLSDLKFIDLWKYEVELLDEYYFTLSEWNETVNYICKNTLKFKTIHSAKLFLLDYQSDNSNFIKKEKSNSQ